jgi:hypothetical protein
MNKSESIKELAMALSKAQAEMPPAPQNANNPFFRSSYADLGSITETAKPVLAKYGLAVSQLIVSNTAAHAPQVVTKVVEINKKDVDVPILLHDSWVGIETILMHESGEWISNIITLPVAERKGNTLVQVAGGTISYLRRYSLAAVLGMYTGDDHDGNGSAKETGNGTKATSSEKNGSTSAAGNFAMRATELGVDYETRTAIMGECGGDVEAAMKKLEAQYTPMGELEGDLDEA